MYTAMQCDNLVMTIWAMATSKTCSVEEIEWLTSGKVNDIFYKKIQFTHTHLKPHSRTDARNSVLGIRPDKTACRLHQI